MNNEKKKAKIHISKLSCLLQNDPLNYNILIVLYIAVTN
jgi:hypothetical protein